MVVLEDDGRQCIDFRESARIPRGTCYTVTVPQSGRWRPLAAACCRSHASLRSTSLISMVEIAFGMSFDLFVSRFQDGEPALFRSSVLVRAIEPFVVETTLKSFELRFPDESGCTVFADTASYEMDGFNVNRPCASVQLYEALLTILKISGMVLVTPSECPPLIGLADTAGHLPADIVEALGKPVLLRSASEILQRIRES